jgi:hypothetical protein
MPVALFQSFVDLRQRKLCLRAGDGEAALVIGPVPRPVFGAEVALHPFPVLGDDQVCLWAGLTLVGGELLAPVRHLCAGGDDLDHQTGHAFYVRVFRLGTARDHHIRVVTVSSAAFSFTVSM